MQKNVLQQCSIQREFHITYRYTILSHKQTVVSTI